MKTVTYKKLIPYLKKGQAGTWEKLEEMSGLKAISYDHSEFKIVDEQKFVEYVLKYSA